MIARATGTFEVVGATPALAYFGGLDAARLSHGYLFSGPSGVGKKTFARRLAQSLFCTQPKDTLLGYDGTCSACRSFLVGAYPDYYESAGAIKIGDPENPEDIRDDEMNARGLVAALSLKAYSGDWRVVVLGDVEFSRSNDDAAHALLKQLEEPERGVLVVLTTAVPALLPNTIRSRLIDIPFGPLLSADVVRILEAEGTPAHEARVAAASAMGSVTRARAILEGAETGLREAAMGWLEDALAGRLPDSSFLDGVTKPAEKRRVASELLEFVRVFARDWAALAIAGPKAPLLAGDLEARVARLPKRSQQLVVAALAAVAETQRIATTSNVSPGLVLDYLRMQLTPD